MIIQQDMDLMKKLTILSDAAKYDAACTSSGVDKKNNGAGLGNAKACGICHSFSVDGRCISLLKILFTNECIYNCRYCVNRSSNDVLRATFTPEEVCRLTIEFYRRNYIEGLFLSSGIIVSPDETMKRLTETVMLLRTKYHFGGYIHLKGIPGASQSLIETAGWYADRMSVNLELPTADGLKTLAPHKSRKNILTPMRQLQRGIHASQNTGAFPWFTFRKCPCSDRLIPRHRCPVCFGIPATATFFTKTAAPLCACRAKHADDYRCHKRNGLSYCDRCRSPLSQL